MLQVLKSLCKIVSAKGGPTDAYCITNSTRPLMCVGPRGSKGGRKTLLYVEALRRYSGEIKEADFTEAYKLALPIFKDRLEQTFIVLKDGNIQPGDKVVTGSNQVPIGSKRCASSDDLPKLGSKRPAN